MSLQPRGKPDAIVRPTEAARRIEVQRVAPGPTLAPFVDYHWYVGWSVGTPYQQQVVPQPRIHLATEHGRLLVHGISREPFFRTLAGSGHALGVAFHPGGFRPFLGRAVSGIAEKVEPAAALLTQDDRPTAAVVLATDDVAAMAAAVEAYLLPLAPQEPDPVVDEVRALVTRVEEDRSITRAEHLARLAGVSLRSLQRLFADYVGIGPKWVINRSRILEAAAVAHSGAPVDWAGVAAELGFSDQAHLVRAFTAVVGTPPEAYRREA
jgi:AraC-like DNA-binding protein